MYNYNKKYIEHLRCIFTIHADSGENYRLDNKRFDLINLCYGPKKAKMIKLKNIHNYRNFKAVKRTNVAGEQYKFLYNDETSIKVSNDLNSDEATKSATTVKLIARCDNGIFIFQGELPEAKAKYERTLTGGKKEVPIVISKEEYLKRCFEKDKTGKYYVLSMVKAAKDAKVNLKPYYDDFSSNFIHSAFKICFDKNINVVPTKNYKNNSLVDVLNDLCKNMKLINKNINTGNFTEIINKTYLSAISGSDTPVVATKNFMNGLKNIYKNNQLEFNADIATALYLQNTSMSGDINQILDCVKEVDNYEKSDLAKIGKLEYNIDDHTNYTSSLLNKLIKDALSDSPFIGTVSKTYYPMIGGNNPNTDKDVYEIFDGGEDEIKKDEDEIKEDEEDDEIEIEEGGETLNGGKKKSKTCKGKTCKSKKQNEEVSNEFDLSQYL